MYPLKSLLPQDSLKPLGRGRSAELLATTALHLPPSLIPLALSMKAAMGDVPMKLPMMLDRPSTQNANVCLGNSFFAFMNPAAQLRLQLSREDSSWEGCNASIAMQH